MPYANNSLPIDASGTIPATQICQTFNEYSTSTPTAIVTSTQICYRPYDIHFNWLIEALFFFGVIVLAIYVHKNR